MSEHDGRQQRACVFEIQRFSIHDGPGIRTTVFLKGCPLHCRWCHNPESIASRPQLAYAPRLCIGCGACVAACPAGAHALSAAPDGADGAGCLHQLDRARCQACGACAAVCPARALEWIGAERTVEEVLALVLRDRVFYESSGGGLTLSGGEPTLAIDFSEALLRAAKAEGLHTCVETCGYAAWERYERLLPLVDGFFFDCKETDPERHREYTGVEQGPILANLRALHERGARIRLRCPVIPGLNDREDHFAAIAALAAELPRLEGVELMPYNILGESKVERFGLDPAPRPRCTVPSPGQVNGWIAALRRHLAATGVALINEPA